MYLTVRRRCSVKRKRLPPLQLVAPSAKPLVLAAVRVSSQISGARIGTLPRWPHLLLLPPTSSCARQFPLSYEPWFLSFAGAQSMPIVTSDRVTRLPALPQRRASAQLFAQARHAPDQTGQQPQHLYCPDDLTAPTNPPCHTRALFHPVSWAARPITNRAADA